MLDTTALLASLQHADSFFPAGGIAFSWGVESLVNDGAISTSEDLRACLAGQLEQRWNNFDRVFLAAAYDAADDLDTLATLDAEIEAMILARESREGSRRAGTSLLLVHEKIQTPGAAAYRKLVVAGAALGHLPIVQAVVWKGVGMTREAVESVSAYAFCIAMIGACLRLGVLGHLASQQIMTHIRQDIARLMKLPPREVKDAHAFTPGAEIAMMRHEVQQSRLFAN